MGIPLPDSGGIEFAGQIREGSVDPAQKKIYIIAMITFAMNEDREICFKAAMNGFLSKPVEGALLKNALSNASVKTQH